MAADLSGLSTDDLRAVASGDMGRVSTAGLRTLAGAAAEPQGAPSDLSQPAQAPGATLPPTPAAGGVGTRLGTVAPGQTVEPRQDEIANLQNFGKAAFAGGITQPAQRIGQLTGIGDVTDEDIRATEDVIKKSPKGGAIGGLTTSLPPFMKAAKVASVFTKAMNPSLLKAGLEFGTTPAIAAAQTALMEPVKSDESAWQKAGKSAVLGKALELGGRALFSPLTGMTTPTKDAQLLLDNNVVPSVSAGTKGFVSSILSVGQGLAGIGGGKQRGIDRVEKEIFEAGLSKTRAGTMISPGTPSTNPEFFKENMGKLYDEIDKITGGKTFPILPNMWDTSARTALAKVKGLPLPQKEHGEILQAIRDIIPPQKSLNAVEMRNAIVRLREERDLARASPSTINDKKAEVWKRVLADVETARNKVLSADEVKLVGEAEKAIHHTGIMQDAARTVDPGKADFGTALIRTLKKADTTPDDMYLAGKGHFMDIAPAGNRILDAEKKGFMNQVASKLAYGTMGSMGLAGAAIPAPVVAGLVGPLVAMGAIGNTRGGAKFLMGQNEYQKKAADIMRTWGRPILGSVGANERE